MPSGNPAGTGREKNPRSSHPCTAAARRHHTHIKPQHTARSTRHRAILQSTNTTQTRTRLLASKCEQPPARATPSGTAATQARMHGHCKNDPAVPGWCGLSAGALGSGAGGRCMETVHGDLASTQRSMHSRLPQRAQDAYPDWRIISMRHAQRHASPYLASHVCICMWWHGDDEGARTAGGGGFTLVVSAASSTLMGTWGTSWLGRTVVSCFRRRSRRWWRSRSPSRAACHNCSRSSSTSSSTCVARPACMRVRVRFAAAAHGPHSCRVCMRWQGRGRCANALHSGHLRPSFRRGTVARNGGWC